MARLSFATLLLLAAPLANAAQCTGNQSMCPNGTDGVSPTYLQCDSWSGTWVTQSCAAGQVCYANPTKPGTAMCGLPGTGGNPGQGKCTGNVAKCAAPGQTGAYWQCNNWSGQYESASCPAGLKCYTGANGTSVLCN